MKRFLPVLFLLLLTPLSHAAAKQDAADVNKDSAGYMTFPLSMDKAQDKKAGEPPKTGGCLWRMPLIEKDGLEVYGAVSIIRKGPAIDAALQVAGSMKKDGEKKAAEFSAIRLTAGESFDTEKIAVTRENGPTARVTFDGAHAMDMATAVADHAGTLFFSHDGKAHEVALPKPSANDTAQIWFCLKELEGKGIGNGTAAAPDEKKK